MALTIPPAKNYIQTLVALPCIQEKEPSEGRMIVPVEIDWGSMGGPNNCVSFNLYGLAAQTISQICMISIDNSACGADVQFIFPDTQQTYTVPAYSPADTFPVFTNQTNFFVSSPGALSSDTTRFGLLNFAVAPSEIPITQLQANVTTTSIAAAVGSTTLIATGNNGTIEAFTINFALPTAAASFNQAVTLQDGSGNVLWGANVAGNTGGTVNMVLGSLTGVNKRFTNGLKLVQTGGTVTGATLDANVYYRTP
jgi:hypothetical protein